MSIDYFTLARDILRTNPIRAADAPSVVSAAAERISAESDDSWISPQADAGPAHHSSQGTPSTGSLDYEDGHATYQVDYHLCGHRCPATETSPAEAPAIVVDRCRLWLGQWSTLVPWDELPSELRALIEDQIHYEEIG